MESVAELENRFWKRLECTEEEIEVINTGGNDVKDWRRISL